MFIFQVIFCDSYCLRKKKIIKIQILKFHYIYFFFNLIQAFFIIYKNKKKLR